MTRSFQARVHEFQISYKRWWKPREGADYMYLSECNPRMQNIFKSMIISSKLNRDVGKFIKYDGDQIYRVKTPDGEYLIRKPYIVEEDI